MKKGDKNNVCAVIVAAGKGTRMNMDVNKQYIEVCGKHVLARTLEAFECCTDIDDIVLVINCNDIIYCKQSIIDAYDFKKVRKLVAGGDERQRSVYNGLIAIENWCDIVVIHDGARPFVKPETISDSIYAAREYGASCVAVPVKDTIKVVDDEGYISSTLDRSTIWAVQTPQTFRYDIIMKAHQKANEDGFLGTDDTVLVERMGLKVKVVMGSYDNIKITTKEDIAVAESIAGMSGEIR